MSNVSEQEHVQDPQWQAPAGDPKATAKAAKAYAKAMRPWYKKKRFLVPIGLVAIIGFTQAGGGDESGPTVTDVPAANAEAKAGDKADSGAEKAAPAEKGSQSNPAKIGQAVDLEGTRYTINAVRTAPTVGGSFLKEKADGVFVVVDLTIENRKDESKIFMDSATQFTAPDGTSYATDSDASIVADDSLILTEMHPDLPTDGTLIFDVPQAKLKGGLLEVSDLFGGGEAYIDLGL